MTRIIMKVGGKMVNETMGKQNPNTQKIIASL